MTTPKTLVSQRALVQRINRVLAYDGQRLIKGTRGYTRVDSERTHVVGRDLDLEQEARQLGVLKPGERLAR